MKVIQLYHLKWAFALYTSFLTMLHFPYQVQNFNRMVCLVLNMSHQSICYTPTPPPPRHGGGVYLNCFVCWSVCLSVVLCMCSSVHLSVCSSVRVPAQYLLSRSTIFYLTWYGGVLSGGDVSLGNIGLSRSQ